VSRVAGVTCQAPRSAITMMGLVSGGSLLISRAVMEENRVEGKDQVNDSSGWIDSMYHVVRDLAARSGHSIKHRHFER